MLDDEVDLLRRRVTELETDNARLRRGATESKGLRDAARIVDEITGNDGGTDPFAAAVRATRMPMVISNPRQADNPIVFVNDAFCRLAGYSREEILGRNCRFLQGQDTDPATVARIRHAIKAVEPVRTDILNYRKNGETFWNRLLMAPVRDANGDLAYFFASQVDVTLERERLAGLESHNAALMAEVADRLHSQQESADRLQFAAKAGRLGFWEHDLDTNRLVVSTFTSEILGHGQRDLLSAADLDAAVHPDDRAARNAAMARSLENGVDFDVEHRVIGSDGSVRWINMRAQIMRDGAGRALRMAGISLDITARKIEDLRRLALVELGDRIRDLAEPGDLAFAAAEILGRTLGISRAGYGLVDPIAETITITRDWTAAGIESLAGVLRFRDYGSYIDDLKRGDLVAFADARVDPRTSQGATSLEALGARAVLNLPLAEAGGFKALFFLNDKGVHHWTAHEIAFVRDVADRTQNAMSRRRAEQNLRALAASLEQQVLERTADRNRLWQLSTDIIVVADRGAVITAINPAWTAMLGWTENELINRKLLDLVHSDDLSRTISGFDDIAAGRTAWRFEIRMLHRDGTNRWISWTMVPGDGVFVGVGRDTTAEREQAAALQTAEEALRQAQKMEAVGQLTGGLAHDFNNLLTGISGSLELLQNRVAQGRINDLDRYILAAQGASKRAAALTHRLLAFSRRQTLDPKPTDVNRLALDMADLIRRTVGPSIAVEVVSTVGLWTALVDPNQLENALLNLCINGRDAMPDGGRLTIETGNRWMDERSARERDVPPGQYLSLCVTDTGTGMPPDVIARAFDPFFTTKPLGQGTGLGLSMIYGFTRQSGGLVRIYSEVGQGTMVCIYLPRHYGAGSDSITDAFRAGDMQRALSGEVVLVVDDEPTVRMLVGDVLSDLGYSCLEAEDGPAGLKVLRSGVRVDLLITDVGLPGGMNGRQVADAARALRADIKVLFITGYAENAVVGNGHLDPGMQILTKPFSIDDLADRIRSLID